MRVINNHRQPITLDCGIVLAAAGTPGSDRDDVPYVTEKDKKRHVAAGRIRIIEEPAAARKSSRVEARKEEDK